MALELPGVGIESFASTLCRHANVFESIFEPAAPTFQDPHPCRRVGSREECEPEAEGVVIPGGGSRLPQALSEVLFA
ncbi:MAG: hypothetical protein ACXWXY_03385, partial [Aeromicrobium sp.]